ncbi:MAG: C25 family cysteine peptidase [Bacteroidota bacterium]
MQSRQPNSSHSQAKKLVLVAPPAAREPLAPLFDIYEELGNTILWQEQTQLPDVSSLQKLAEKGDGLLVIGNRKRAPSTVVPGPYIRLHSGRKVPVGWVPFTSREALHTYAQACAAVHARPKGNLHHALLSQWHPRYLRMASRLQQGMKREADIRCFSWTSDVVFPEDMLKGMQSGLALAIYLGHGRPVGWVGYHGIRRHHLEEGTYPPLGSLISLCCLTASRRRNGLSFAETAVLKGVAAVSLGAIGPTRYTNNTRIAVAISRGIREGASSMGELITHYFPSWNRGTSDYRLIGDPLAPLSADPHSLTLAEKIPVYT